MERSKLVLAADKAAALEDLRKAQAENEVLRLQLNSLFVGAGPSISPADAHAVNAHVSDALSERAPMHPQTRRGSALPSECALIASTNAHTPC
jgi:hypothetical protein